MSSSLYSDLAAFIVADMLLDAVRSAAVMYRRRDLAIRQLQQAQTQTAVTEVS